MTYDFDERKSLLRAIVRTSKRENRHRLGWQLQQPDARAKLEAVRDRKAKCRAQVPPWVPDAMRDDYLKLARDDGEEAAAAWARAEKRGMR